MALLKGGGDFAGGGGLWCCWMGLVLLSICLPNHLIIPVSGDPTAQCVQLGQAGGASGWRPQDGPFTIGAEKFRMRDWFPMSFTAWGAWRDTEEIQNRWTCPKGWLLKPNIEKKDANYYIFDFCPNQVTIRTYLVKQNERVLRGWLYFEVELNDTSDQMEYIYVQMRDEHWNAIGEFVSDEKEQCKSDNSPLISPTPYQFLPCSATGVREAKTAGAIFMANSTQYANSVDPKYLPSKELRRGIHFTWRLNEYWCNRHQRLRLDAYVWTRKSWDNRWKYNVDERKCPNLNKDCSLKRKVSDYWIYPKWFGAADIKIHGPLDCDTPAIDFGTGVLHSNASSTWLDRTKQMTFGDDYMATKNIHQNPDGSRHYLGCQLSTRHGAYKTPTFGGRCLNHKEKNASREILQGCNTNELAPEFVGLDGIFTTTYSNYTASLHQNRTYQCKQTCEEPDINNPKHLEEIQSFPMNDDPSTNQTRKRRVHFGTLVQSRVATRATTFWQTRKFHGNVCIFFAMFLLPVSNLLIRYYKETFMHSMSLGCAPWFWFHMLVCFAVPTLYRSGYAAMQQNIQNFGRSEDEHAVLHRYAGRIFIWVFCLMVAIGGIRFASIRARHVCMTMHSVTGFVLYLLAIALIINSTYIPSSPSLHSCKPDSGLPVGLSGAGVGWYAVAWLAIDALFHVILTIMQFAIDRRYGIVRAGFGLPFIPILPADGRRDLVGSRLRKVLLLLYVFLSLGLTIKAMVQLFGNEDPRNCTLGNLTCDLNQTLPNKESSPFGCAAFSLKFYAKFWEKYKIFTNITEKPV